MANVFDTFSFTKWKDSKKDEEIDKESRRRRNEQVKRLKERLRWEREHREKQTNNGDLDLDALIEALQRGEEINSDEQLDNFTPRSEEPDKDLISDDDILQEIHKYQHDHEETGPPSMDHPESRFWKYNRRFNDVPNENRTPQDLTPTRIISEPTQRLNSAESDINDHVFKYNRKIAIQ